MKIISGGQTGVDRAALDVALKHQIVCGGSVPAGRLDEFGRIPEHYPVQELAHGGLAERTSKNIDDSDGTVIFYCGKLFGGTEDTLRFCIEQNRPYLLIDAIKLPAEGAAELIADFGREKGIHTLNVAGPRQTEWAGGYDYAFQALDVFLLRRFRF